MKRQQAIQILTAARDTQAALLIEHIIDNQSALVIVNGDTWFFGEMVYGVGQHLIEINSMLNVLTAMPPEVEPRPTKFSNPLVSEIIA